MPRMIIAPPNLQLPWTSTDADDGRFWKIFGILLVPFVVLSLIIPFVKVPEPDRAELERLPPQLAKVVLEKQELPPPPPPPEPKKEEPKEEKKEEPKKEEPKKEEPKPKEPEPEPVKLVEEAREAAQAEINQFADALSDMREAFDLSEVNANDLVQSTGEAAEIDRSIIGRQAKSGSGGIRTTDMSRDTGGVALSGKTDTKVDSKLATAEAAAKAKKPANRDKAFRSEEDVRKVMDQNKSAIFAIYNRELRKDPTLEGKFVFQITIGPDGRVLDAKVISSELDNSALENKLLARIKLINFGTRNVLETKLNYSLDFLPY